MEQSKQRIAWLLAIVATLLPVLIAAHYVVTGSVNVPYYDEWDLVPLVEKWLSGESGWRDLLRPNLGPRVTHAIPFAKAAAVLSASLFHWDVRLEVWAGFGLLLGSGTIVALYARRSGAMATPAQAALFLMPALGLLFSLRQFENLLAPWAITFFGVVFFALATLYLLSQRTGPLSLLAAIACATAASLSLTNGLLVWPLGLALLLRNRRYAAVWLLAAGVFLTLFFKYLYLVVPVDGTFSVAMVARRFFGALGGALAMDKGIITGGGSGSGAAPDFHTAALLGVAILLLAGYLVWLCRKNLRQYAFPISGLLFAVMSCLMLAYGRSNLGVGQALSSRYTTISLLALVCIVAIMAQLRASGVKLPHLTGGLVAVVMLATVHAALVESMMLPHRRGFLERWAASMRDYRSADLTNPHFTQDQIRAYAATLERLKLSVFSGPAASDISKRENPRDLPAAGV